MPLYSFDNSVPPPKLINTGTNYKKILQSLLDYGNWISAHRPEAALTSNFVVRGSKIERGFRHDLDILRSTKKRTYEIRSGDDQIVVVSKRQDLFTARVTEHIISQRVSDESGRVTSEHRFPSPTTTYLYVVARVGERWLIADGSELDRSVRT